MTDANGRAAAQSAAGRFLGSLKDALQAAGRPEAQPAMQLPEITSRARPHQSIVQPAPVHSAPLQAGVVQASIMQSAGHSEPGGPAGAPSPERAADPAARPANAAPVSEPAPMPAAPTEHVAAEQPLGAKPPALPPLPSAAEAAREARGRQPRRAEGDHHREFDEPMTRIVRPAAKGVPLEADDAAPRTQVLRGRQAVARGEFKQDPVVGWLVVVGGNGLGSFRPIFEGNNSIGRSPSNRIAVDFGDDAISSGEQAYIRYDSNDRSFLLVPNLAKTNVVALNDKRPTAAVPINAMDVITMGRTQLVFVPFCGPDFDWSELGELRT